MLKTIPVFLLCMFFPLLLMAQVGERRSTFSLGFNGGMAFSTMDFTPTIKQLSHSGIVGGLSARYTCEKYFSTVCALQAELNYAQLGWKEDILSQDGKELPDTYERTLNYVQLPLMTRLGWGKEQGGLMFFILLGPQLGYYISSSTKQSDTWTLDANGNPDRPNNVYQQYSMEPERKLDYGILGGLGLEFSTRSGQRFALDGRYYFGLGDTFNNGKKDPFSRSAHTTITVKLSYLFDLNASHSKKAEMND